MKKNIFRTPKLWISSGLFLAGLVALVQASYAGALAEANQGEIAIFAAAPSTTPALKKNLYMPVVMNNYCPTYLYNETLRYNMSIINAPQVWNCNLGQGITVAIIDTGADLDHPDLQANLVAGYNFWANPDTASPEDDNGHGSHVAGITAGVGNNGNMIGVAPRAKIMPIKVLNSSGSGYMSDAALAVIWAADHGAKVINLSLGGVTNNAAVSDAVMYAYNKGILVIAAAGNCGDSNYIYNGCTSMNQTLYPAALDAVVAVAATTSSDTHASYSNAGAYVDIAAPGSGIYSAYSLGRYWTLDGTSQAAPHVAGLAALIWSRHPTWTRDQVRTQIYNTAVDLGTTGIDTQFGHGRINASAAAGITSLNSEASTAPEAEAVQPEVNAAAAYARGVVLVKLDAGYSLAKVLDDAGVKADVLQTAYTLSQIGVYELTVPDGQEAGMVKKLLDMPGIQYAELDTIVTMQ